MPIISSLVAAGTALVGYVGGYGATAAVAYGAYAGVQAKQSATDKRKAAANATADAAASSKAQSQAIEKKAAEAEAVADRIAKEEGRRKLQKQTQTIFTSGLGLLGSTPTKKTTLGAN